MVQAITIGSLALIPLCYVLIQHNSIMDYILIGLFAYIVVSLISAGIKEDAATGLGIWKDRMIALVIFMIINIAFWACLSNLPTPAIEGEFKG